MPKSLVLARVGATSLHPCWLDRGKPRDWDLRLVPYQELPDQSGVDCVVGDVVPGPKWTGLRHVLNTWDGWREYDYVWLPDDDVFTTQDAITRLFESAEALGFDLFAPALHETSWYAHFITMRNRRFHARRTGFVEIMVPAFSRAALEKLLPTLDLTVTGWGWGLDSVWPKLLGYENVGIIDAVPVIHTRPVGVMRDVELARAVRQESDTILASHDCRQMHTHYAGYGADLEPLDLAPEALLARLIDGFGYLIERDPRVLAWIMEFQRPLSDWPEYPIAGTPEQAPY
jgi:Protein of unknown function (DUF707)